MIPISVTQKKNEESQHICSSNERAVLSHTHHALRVGVPASKGPSYDMCASKSANEESVATETTHLLKRTQSPIPVQIGDPSDKGLSNASEADAKQSKTISAWLQHVFLNVSIGLVNTVLTIPCLFGYSAIIYAHPAFRDIVPMLAKLILLSSVVHQICFSLLSSMPFAIGQVQDSGLIFLSAIATSICTMIQSSTYPSVMIPASAAEAAKRPPLSPEQQAMEHDYIVTVTSTTVVVLGLATCVMGAVMVIMGRFKLAKLVSYLPMPVISGYLAFIGFFCFCAGLSICTGENINTLEKFPLLWNYKYIIHCLPALICGLLLFYTAKTYKNPMALPAAMVAMPVTFYTILFLTNTTIQESRDSGWISPLNESAAPSDVFALLDFNKVHWWTLPSQGVQWIIMTIVLAFASCLDVAAIEIDLGRPLDINHELETVGWSNFFAGGLGGYAGSYIFSQTIFTCRTGSRSYLVGWVVAFVELTVFLLPVDVMSYVPRFFFAATLLFIAYDLMYEWLLQMYIQQKVSAREHVVCVSTFFAILLTNVQLGLLIGVLIAIVNFIWDYAQSSRVIPALKRSSVRLDTELEKIVEENLEEIRILPLSGHIFFGSALSILDASKEAILVEVEFPFVSPPHNKVVLPLRDYERSQQRSEESFTNQLLSRMRVHKGQMLKREQDEAMTLVKNPQHLELSSGSFSGIARSAEVKSNGSRPREEYNSYQISENKTNNNSKALRTVPSLRSIVSSNSQAVDSYGSSDSNRGLRISSSNVSLIRSASPESPVHFSQTVFDPVLLPQTEQCNQLHEETTDVQCQVPQQLKDYEAAPTHTLILDFSLVHGVDVTAVRSCFLILSHAARECGVDLVYSGLGSDIELLLRNNNVITKNEDFNEEIVKNFSHDATRVLAKYPTTFPSTFPSIASTKGQVFVAPDVDLALQWAEARLIFRKLSEGPQV